MGDAAQAGLLASRVSALPGLPSFRQWLSGALAAHSCGDSRGFEGVTFFRVPFSPPRSPGADLHRGA